MIFNNIDDITSKADKSLLLELIDVYVKSVKEMASRKHIDVIEDTHILPPEEVVSEIIEMGIIRSKEQLTLLKRVLGSLYPDFINSVSTYIYHRKQFDGVLDKFNNRKRLQMQAVELASDKPIVADFFAGAGGLSLGFSQAGYRICFANDFQDVCINTYRFNHPEIPSNRILCDDIRKIVWKQR